MGNDLEEIKKLYAKPKTFLLPKEPKEGQLQITIELYPLTLDEIGVLNTNENASSEEMAKNAIMLLAKSMRIPEEEIKQISFEYLTELMEAVAAINNFSAADKQKSGIDDFIARKQKQLAEQKE